MIRGKTGNHLLTGHVQGKGEEKPGIIPRFLALFSLVFKCPFHSFSSSHLHPGEFIF